MVGNLFLRRRASGVLKHDFRTYIPRYTSPNDNLEYGYPHSNVLLQSRHKSEHCKLHKGVCHPTKCDLINDVKTISDSISQDILSQIFDIIRSDVTL